MGACFHSQNKSGKKDAPPLEPQKPSVKYEVSDSDTDY